MSHKIRFTLVAFATLLSPILHAQNNNAVNSLPAIIYLLQEEQDKVVKIGLGSFHSCALLESGSIKCWGRNTDGQLGNGATDDSSLPVKVNHINKATDIAAGSRHSCALIEDGSIKCWGFNGAGQLGNGMPYSSLEPTMVEGITNATEISLGGDHSCARLSGGTFLTGPIKCWGDNQYGELGDGSNIDYSLVPVDVNNIVNASQLSLGNGHSCAKIGTVFDGNTIQCWGRNNLGQLGNNTTNNSPEPVSVIGIDTAKDISTGAFHSCAMLTNKTAFCWGDNGDGQLGDDSTNDSPVPVQVTSNRPFEKISAGSFHTCARTEDTATASSAILCWGDNEHGQLGDGTYDQSPTGVSVSNIDPIGAYITLGSGHTCALIADNSVRCWGRNSRGQLGNGTQTGSTVPILVLGL